MEGIFLTGQSPQWAVVPTEEEEEDFSGRNTEYIFASKFLSTFHETHNLIF